MLIFSIAFLGIFKLEEELMRVRYILSEGDAAAFLPSKSHGLLDSFIWLNCVAYVKIDDELMIDGFVCYSVSREVFEDVFGAY